MGITIERTEYTGGLLVDLFPTSSGGL